MDNDIKIAQVIAMIPNITPEQVVALGANAAISEEILADAHGNYGFEADRRTAMISLDVPFPVLELAHQTILGILSGIDSLTQTWRTVFGDFKGIPVEIPTEIVDTPTEETVETAGQSMEMVDNPVDTSEPVQEELLEVPAVDSASLENGAI
jgi:hypothetical protein